jgi:hypothetical protein
MAFPVCASVFERMTDIEVRLAGNGDYQRLRDDCWSVGKHDWTFGDLTNIQVNLILRYNRRNGPRISTLSVLMPESLPLATFRVTSHGISCSTPVNGQKLDANEEPK